MEPNLILLTIVQNDSDIIESFVRHNVPLFDRTIIIDHGSTDETIEIIRRLKDEGFNLVVESHEYPIYDQTRILESRYRRLIHEDAFDFFFCLDPDEFIKVSDKDSLKAVFNRPNVKYYLEVENYIYPQAADVDQADPVKRMVRRRDAVVSRKAVIPNVGRYTRKMLLTDQGRDFKIPGHPFHFEISSIRLAKFPIRSKPQFETKQIRERLSAFARGNLTRSSLGSSELRRAKARDGSVTSLDMDLTRISYNYGSPEHLVSDAGDLQLVDDPMDLNYDSLKWGAPIQYPMYGIVLFSEMLIRYSIYRNGRIGLMAAHRRMLDDMRRSLMQYKGRQIIGKLLHRIVPGKCMAMLEHIRHYPARRRAIVHARQYLISPTAPISREGNSILYVSGKKHIPFSTIRYRCYNLLDYLREAGWTGSLLLEEDIPLLEESILRSPPALCVMIRLEATPTLISFIKRLRAAGTKIVYDVDDLVFDVELDKERSAKSIQPERTSSVSFPKNDSRGKGYIPLMRLADALTATTTALVDEERAIAEHCYKIPNSIAHFQERVASEIEGKHAGDDVLVGYLSGSPTHNTDFLLVAEQLYHVLLADKRVKFILVGHLELPDYYSLLSPTQFIRYPTQSALGYFKILSTCDINIVPLESRRANHCKSELKVFEAAALSIPSIASPTRQHVECIENWSNGVIADSYDDWTNALIKLVVDRQLRNNLGTAAKATIGKQFSYRTVGPIAESVYRSILELRS